MQEEGNFAMEKKSTPRQQPTPSKTLSTERKSEYPKHNGRRRWKDNSSPCSRAIEPLPSSTKPPSKWNRGSSDKRPRQRGYYGNRQREEIDDVDDTMDVFSTSSRKGDANELLKFHFAPRGDNGSQPYQRWSGYRGTGGSHGRNRKTVRYNKEQFLQASCQFVVKDDGEYLKQAVDPDALVKWELIELVRIFSTEAVQCPICLNKPLAGKITKCGHIYCCACMLRYLALGEKDYRKCPICYDAVKAEDLKSVQPIEVPDYKVGDSIEMKLMRKSKGSVYVCPKQEWKERNGVPLNFQEGENTRFAKLLIASRGQIQTDVIELEKAALEVQLAESEEEEKPFISMAQEMLKNREMSLQAVEKQNGDEVEEKTFEGQADELDEKAGSKVLSAFEDKVPVFADAFEDELELPDSPIPCDSDTELESGIASLDLSVQVPNFEGVDDDMKDEEETGAMAAALSQSSTSDRSSRQRGDSECSIPFGSPVNPYPMMHHHAMAQPNLSPEEVSDHLELPAEASKPMQPTKRIQQTTKDTYYFYQAATGQHIYLHSLNARCLQQEFDTLENGPATISATIVAIKRMFMTEELRKRLRYLSHIPLTCEFHVVELDLKPPVLSKNTLRIFKGEIDKLRRERQKRAREDKVRARQNELDHKQAHGLFPSLEIPLDSQQQFPSHLSSSSPPIQMTADSIEISSSPDYHTESGWGPQTEASPTQRIPSAWEAKSFAKIAGAGAWPSVQPSAQHWRPSPVSPTVSAVAKRSQGDDSGGEDLAAPSYNDSMAADIGNLINQRLNSVETVEVTQGNNGGGKKKKKKTQKQLLFSTSMARKS